MLDNLRQGWQTLMAIRKRWQKPFGSNARRKELSLFLICLFLADLSSDEGWDDLVHRVEAHPDPVVAILSLELL